MKKKLLDFLKLVGTVILVIVLVLIPTGKRKRGIFTNIKPPAVEVVVNGRTQSFKKFVAKYEKLDSSKLDAEDKEIYDLLKEKIMTHCQENNLSLSDEDQTRLANLIWKLMEEDVEVYDDIFGALADEFIMPESSMMDLLTSALEDTFITYREPTEEELEYILLLAKAKDFDETKLSSEQKEIFVRLQKNVSNFINEYEIDFDEDEIYLFTVVLYNAMSSKDDLETFLVFHEYDIEDFKELVGDLYEKFEISAEGI